MLPGPQSYPVTSFQDQDWSDCNSADIDYEAMNLRILEQYLVKSRHQGSAFPPGGNVAAAKVRHHGDAGKLDQ